MKAISTVFLSIACFTASSQSDIDYPYNPDFENDGFVGIEDVLELLSVYGTPFTPEQLLLDGASLTEIIESLQSQIDSLASYTNEGFGAIALNDSLLTEYLVGVAAASEEGDSTLGAWVMQLSEVVEQQQAQIDSLQFLSSVGNYSLVNFSAGEISFVGNSAKRVVLELDSTDYMWYRLTGHNLQNAWYQVDSVAINELGLVAQEFGGIYKMEPMPRVPHFLSLDYCELSDLRVEFSQSFDAEWLVGQLQQQLQSFIGSNYFDEIEIIDSPKVRILFNGAHIGDISAPHKDLRYNPEDGWTVDQYVETPDWTRSHFWRLLDGSWSPY